MKLIHKSKRGTLNGGLNYSSCSACVCVSLGCFYGPNILEPIVRDWNPNYHNEITFGPPIPLPFNWKIPFFFLVNLSVYSKLHSISSAQEKRRVQIGWDNSISYRHQNKVSWALSLTWSNLLEFGSVKYSVPRKNKNSLERA